MVLCMLKLAKRAVLCTFPCWQGEAGRGWLLIWGMNGLLFYTSRERAGASDVGVQRGGAVGSLELSARLAPGPGRWFDRSP